MNLGPVKIERVEDGWVVSLPAVSAAGSGATLEEAVADLVASALTAYQSLEADDQVLQFIRLVSPNPLASDARTVLERLRR